MVCPIIFFADVVGRSARDDDEDPRATDRRRSLKIPDARQTEASFCTNLNVRKGEFDLNSNIGGKASRGASFPPKSSEAANQAPRTSRSRIESDDDDDE